MLHEKPKPYIGISGIPNDINGAAKIGQMLKTHYLSTHQWMTGYLATEQTLRGKKSANPNFSSLDNLPELLSQTNDSAVNSIHYSTRNPATVSTQINALFTRTGVYEDNLCRGLQLNNRWPDPQEVSQIKSDFPDIVLILQLGSKTLLESDGRIAGKVSRYKGAIDCLLIDPSMGKGKPIDIQRAASLYTRLKNEYPGVSIIFAGGIDPENVKAIVGEIGAIVGTKNFGIDAQSGLLTPKPDRPGTFDVNKARKYAENAVTVFSKAGNKN